MQDSYPCVSGMLPVKTTLEPNVADFGTSIPMQVPNPDPLKPLNRPSDRVQHTFNIRTLIITNTTLGGEGGLLITIIV